MTTATHPRETDPCPECDADPETWTEKRELPQIGQTYACDACGTEAFAYDASDPGDRGPRKWTPVTAGMARDLLFYDEFGAWPEQVVDQRLFVRGRPAAIDYHVTEHADYTVTEWADAIGVSQAAVSKNAAKARRSLAE